MKFSVKCSFCDIDVKPLPKSDLFVSEAVFLSKYL